MAFELSLVTLAEILRLYITSLSWKFYQPYFDYLTIMLSG